MAAAGRCPDSELRPTVAALAAALGSPRPAAKVLVPPRPRRPRRGARVSCIPRFDDLLDPTRCCATCTPAVDASAAGHRGGEKILIYGDYDVDGTTSVVLLTKAIELAGGKADFHVPHRLKDGYGMRPGGGGATAAAQGVTPDRQRGYRHPRGGSGARAPTSWASTSSSPIITCPKRELPPALAVLNPNRPGLPLSRRRISAARAWLSSWRRRCWRRSAGRPTRLRRVSRIVSEDGGDRDGGRCGAAHRRESRHREARTRRAGRRCAIPDCARCSMSRASPAMRVPPRARWRFRSPRA